MDLWSAPAHDVRPLLTAGRGALVARLASLAPADWAAPTEAGHWSVGDVARHLVDDDLGLLSRWRDGDGSGRLPTGDGHAAFVSALDAKNQRWVEAAAALSGRVVAELLAWSGAAVDTFLATIDLHERRHVSWAGGTAPAWFDIAREHTERWVHGRHISDALGATPDPAVAEVLRTFVWAFPAQLGPAPTGTTVGVQLGVDRWTVQSTGDGWSLTSGWPASADAVLRLRAEDAWRQLTGLAVRPGALRADGEPALVAALRSVRSIIV